MALNPKQVEIYIDELVLHGFSAHDRRYIGVAVQTELTRLFTEQGIPSSFSSAGKIPVLNAGTFDLQPAAKAETVGNNIANSIYKGFANEK